MNELKNNTEDFISKYLSGNMTPDEESDFKTWLSASPDNEKIFTKSKRVWELSKNRISPEIIIRDKFEVLRKIHFKQSKKMIQSRKKLLFYKIAAILAIPLTFALSWYFIGGAKNTSFISTDSYCEVVAPKGHVAKCILPDGSHVWLNTNSKISYRTATFNQKYRDIRLSGEAYFEVTKNEQKPFKVITPIANINVTGTSFNIKAYPESNIFETVLAEGGIEMRLNSGKQQKVILVPGEKAVFSEEMTDISVEKVEPDYYTSWRNGELLFKDATLNDLVYELGRIYDIRFHLEDEELGEFRFRGMFSYNNNLIEALEKIERTAHINYYIENKEVWLTKTR